MSDSHDLSQLIRQADEQAQNKAQSKAAPQRSRIQVAAIFSGVLLVVIAYAGVKVFAAFSPPSEAKVAHDLERVVESAHQLVDGIKKETGKLPDAIPNAALASVVQYEKRDADYKLSATILGVRVSLEGAGKMTTETGVK